MLDLLLPHYEAELDALRTGAAAFGARFPKVAQHLRLDPGAGPDPHTERLAEGFALLAARIQRKLDDEFPGITEAFMRVLYPQDLQPLPAATILHLQADPERPEPWRPVTVPRLTPVLAPPVRGIRCGFRTTQAVDLWPVEVARAGLELDAPGAGPGNPAAALTLELESPPGLPFSALAVEHLTFFLDGEPPLMHLLYELLCFRTQTVLVDGGAGAPRALPAAAILPVGLEPDEALVDPDPRSCPGSRLVTEYFAFPDKFLFFRLAGLGALTPATGSRMRLRFLFSRLGAGDRHRRLRDTLSPSHFKLGCVPAVNLFRRAAVPIPVTHREAAYLVVPEGLGAEACQVHAIDAVFRAIRSPGAADRLVPVPCIYAVRHGQREEDQGLFWYAARASAPHPGGEEPLELALVDLDFQPIRPGRETLSLQLTCTNRDLPQGLPSGGGPGTQADFLLPAQPLVRRVQALRKPTPALKPPPRCQLRRRIVTQLALGQLPLDAWDLEALLEALDLCRASAATGPVDGICALAAAPCTAWIPGRESATPVRGTQVSVTFDESRLVGFNLYLFANILERFFGLLCGPNTFMQFRMSTRQQEGETARWPPRSGATPLT
jgi:type VI secretion system protein ImpG